MLDLLETAHRRLPAVALGLGAALAIGLGGCGPQEDPTKGDVPPPPLTTATTPPDGDKAVAGKGGDQSPKGKQKGDDDDGGDGSGGSGDGGGSSGGGRGGGSSGDAGGGDGGQDRPDVPDVRTTLRLTMREGDPPEFSTTTLSSRAGRVTLILRNDDDEEHGIAVAGTEISPEESDGVEKGKTVSITVELPPGEYTFYCPVDEHQIDNPDGETGLLTVT